MKKDFLTSLRLMLLMTLLLGFIYPSSMTVLAKVFFKEKSEGQVVQYHNRVIGSYLIAQKFTEEKYFWPRLSATDYNALPSGGSNLGPTSKILKTQIRSHPGYNESASASGLDPHISIESAKKQAPRVAEARHLTLQQVVGLVQQNSQGLWGGFLGEEVVNVLALNLALDNLSKNLNQETQKGSSGE